DMLEADELCDRIAIMNHGKIAAMGSPAQLKSSIRGDLITLDLSSPLGNVSISSDLGLIVSSEETLVKIQTDDAGSALPRLIEFFSGSGIKIESISINRPNLDDVFAKYTKSTLAQEDVTMFKEARMTRKSFARHAG
ncbi:MAG TPA: DUF4162 domain-containing protein, partial [Nitrososphaerales archaeon]|nr:DUF4162 domain-containing protein [Nitrososphaerales archaeon]